MYRSPDALIRNVHSQVADRVGISIVRGDVGIGETLPSEMQICQMMDVSRTVVREAIRTLSGKGLVEARPKSGTRVRSPEQWNQLDPDVLRWRLETTEMDSYLNKLFQLRCAVEPAAAALAATAAGEPDVARIRVGYDGMAAAKVNEAFVAADIAFIRRSTLPPATNFSGRSRRCSTSRCARVLLSPPAGRTAHGRWSSITPCWMRLRPGTRKAPARRPTFC